MSLPELVFLMFGVVVSLLIRDCFGLVLLQLLSDFMELNESFLGIWVLCPLL